jgi:hypothetical protein
MRCSSFALISLTLASASVLSSRVVKLTPEAENGIQVFPDRVIIGLPSDSVSASHILYSSLAQCDEESSTSIVLASSGFSFDNTTHQIFKKVFSDNISLPHASHEVLF